MVNEASIADSERRQAYLRCVCAALNFDVGEIWSWRNDDSTQNEAQGDQEGVMAGGGRGDSGSASSSSSFLSMRFIQLYTSPSFRNQRSKLVTPSEDWEQSKADVSKHKFSPLICEAVRDGGAVVWANTAVEGGLLGRSDLPLRTAVGAPVCTQCGDLCVLVLFSPSIIDKSPEAMEFLFTLAQAASDAANAFLPASSYSPVHPVTFPNFWWRNSQARLQKLDAIRESLPRDITFDTDTLPGDPFGHPERSLRAVRSVYNDGRGASGAPVIPSELWANRGGGGKAGFLNSVTAVGMTGNRSVKPAMSPSGSGGDMGGSAAPKRRASFQSNAPLDLSLGSSVTSDEGIDTEDCNLWAAFMESDSPPGSPTSAPMSAAPGQDMGEGDRSGNNADDASYQSLSALLSTSVSVTSLASLSSDDENESRNTSITNNNGAIDSDMGLLMFAPSATLKQELVEDSKRDRSSSNMDQTGIANGQHADNQQVGFSGAGLAGAGGAGDGNGFSPGASSSTSSALVVSSTPTVPERLGMIWNEQKWARFNEFISGMLSVSLFQAADVWLPLARGTGDAKATHLSLFTSKIQDSKLSKWSDMSRNVVLASGVGLPGLVFYERRPQWAVDYSKVDSARNPLASMACLLGIGSAFGVPLPLDDSDECGVVMLYSTSCLPPSELMVEFMERATGLLLADAPVPSTLRQHCRDKALSAKDIGRIAGAYKHHALWDQQKSQNGSTSNGSISGGGSVGGVGGGNSKLHPEASAISKPQDGTPSSSESAPQSVSGIGGWTGTGSALAVAAAAAASGGQGGGFRTDGGAVAFIPRDWPSNENPSPELVFNRVDLDGRSSFTEDNAAAKAAVEAVEPPSPACLVRTQTSTRKPPRSESQRQLQLSVMVSSALASRPVSARPPRPRNEPDERACALGVAAKRPRVIREVDNAGRKGAVASAFSSSAAASKAAMSNGVFAVSASSVGKGKAGARRGATAASATPAVKLDEESTEMAEKEKAAAKSREGRAGSRKSAVASEGRGGGAVISQGGNAAAASNSLGTSRCRAQGCDNVPNGRTPFCWDHWSAARQCQHPGCDKLSQGNTRLCIAHGGGRRCTHSGCNKGARDRFFCAAHGGGKRCSVVACGKAAVGGSDLCTGHGGGKRCQYPACPKSAQSKTNFCVRHGGGRKCAMEGCVKVARGRTSHCAAHGGGIRCCVEGCNKAAVGRERMCRSHQRKSKAGVPVVTSSTAVSAAAAATGYPHGSTVDRARLAPLASSSRAAADSSTALSVLSAAAETHGSTDLLESTSLSPQPPQPFTARANGSTGVLRWGGVEAGGSGSGGGGGGQSIFSQAVLGETSVGGRSKRSAAMMNGSVAGADTIEGAMFVGSGGGGGQRVRRLASPFLRGPSS